jgi:hypothetical protein
MHSAVIPAIDPGQGIIFCSYDDAFGTWWGRNGGDLGVSTNMFFDEATNTGLITLANSDGDHEPIRDAILDALDPLANEYVADIACEILLTTSTPELARAEPFTVFPNPATDHISLSLDKCIGQVSIMDMTGKLVWSQACAQNMDIRHLEPGTYIVALHSPVGERTSMMVKH